MYMSIACAVVDRAVMIASRRPRNFAPGSLTVTLHTCEEPVTIEGRPLGPTVPAPNWPELCLPTYTFDSLTSGLYPTVDLETFSRAFDWALDHIGNTLVVAIHADVPDHDLDDAYAWRYDWQARGFTMVPPGEAAAFFHEDTHVLAYPWDEAPFASASALALPAR